MRNQVEIAAFLGLALAVTVSPLAAAGPAPGTSWTTVFASVDAETLSTFGSTGSKRGLRLAGDPQSVFIAGSYGLSLSDVERARRARLPQDQIDAQARLMLGFERSVSHFFLSASLGPSLARIKKQYATGSEVRAGVVGQIDLWWRPRDDLYLNWTTTGDTAEQSWWNRWRLGWRPAALPFAVGPEFSAGTGRNWNKLKVGCHIGDIAFWRIGLDASAGWMIDENDRSGAYASAAIYLRY